MTITKKDLIYFSLILILVMVIFWKPTPKTQPIYEIKVKELNKEFEILKEKVHEKDSIINNADSHELDSLFTDFFARTKMLRE